MERDFRETGKALRVIDIEAFVVPDNPRIPVMNLKLEDGEDFYLYSIPYDIVEVFRKVNGDEVLEEGFERQSIFDILSQHDDFKNMFKEDLDYVIIDEFDPETMLFTASVYFSNGAARIVRKMIPSHAIFLALVAEKPVYVSKEIVDIEKKISGE